MKKTFLTLTLFSITNLFAQTYVVDAGANASICEGDSITLSASAGLNYNMSISASSAMNYSFQGDFNGNDPSISAEVGQTLNFNVQSPGHPFCIKTSQTTGSGNAIPGLLNNGTSNGLISWTPSSPGTYYYICEFHSMMVGTITISASSSTNNYTWSPGGQTGSSIIVAPTSTTNYSVTASNSNGMQASDAITVSVNPLPSPIILDMNVCQGSSVTLNHGSQLGYNFVYCCGFVDGVPTTVNQTTTVTFTATDPQTGCSSDGLFIIFADPLPTINGISAPNQVLCPGDTTSDITWSPSNTYSWTNNNVNIGLAQQGLGSNINAFIVQNQTSQVQVATIVITPTFNQCSGIPDTATITVNPSTSSTLNEVAVDSFELNGQIYTQPGTYTQVIANSNGCDSTITLNLSLSFSGLNQNEFENLKAYPNPTNNFVEFDGINNLDLKDFTICNSQGKTLKTINLINNRIDLSGLDNGIYFIKITTENKVKTIRIIKN
jgi:plastocyanin